MRHPVLVVALATSLGVTSSAITPLDAQTARVSVRQDGSEVTGDEWAPSAIAVSANGFVLAFDSPIDSLVPGDTNIARDVFLRDLGAPPPSPPLLRAYPAGVEPNGDSFHPSMSADGTRVAFSSRATNLIPGDTSPGERVFVFDRVAQTLMHISAPPDVGSQFRSSRYPSISPNGRFVAFLTRSSATFWRVYIRDLQEAQSHEVATLLSLPTAWKAGPAVADDGSVAFLDTMGSTYVVRVVRVTGTPSFLIASTDASGASWPSGVTELRPSISADGRHVSYQVAATHGIAGTAGSQPAVVVKRLDTGAVTLVDAQADGTGAAAAQSASLSADGRTLAFFSTSTTLAAGASRAGLYRADLDGGSAVVMPLQPGPLEQWWPTPVAVSNTEAITYTSAIAVGGVGIGLGPDITLHISLSQNRPSLVRVTSLSRMIILRI